MKSIHVSLFLFGATLITSCCFRGRNDQTIPLPEAIVNALPYMAQQEVVFVSNTGDTVKTTVQDLHEFYPDNCAECYCKSTNYERHTYTLTQKDNTTLVYIIADSGWEPGTQIEVALDNSFFIIPLAEDGKFQCDTSGMSMTACYDSLVIQNHSYQNVFQLDISNVPDTATFRIFYNADKGLLRMEQKDGRFWEVL